MVVIVVPIAAHDVLVRQTLPAEVECAAFTYHPRVSPSPIPEFQLEQGK
jgi:hypothetical protein